MEWPVGKGRDVFSHTLDVSPDGECLLYRSLVNLYPEWIWLQNGGTRVDDISYFYNRNTQESATMTSTQYGIDSSEESYPSKATWNSSSDHFALIWGEKLLIFDRNCTCNCTVDLPVFSEQACFTPDGENILVLDCYWSLSEYSVSDGKLISTANMSKYFSDGVGKEYRWDRINTSTVGLYYWDSNLLENRYFFIDTDPHAFGAINYIPNGVMYNQQRNRIYCLHYDTPSEIWYFPYYSVEELIQMGQEILHPAGSRSQDG